MLLSVADDLKITITQAKWDKINHLLDVIYEQNKQCLGSNKWSHHTIVNIKWSIYHTFTDQLSHIVMGKLKHSIASMKHIWIAQ